MPEYVRRREIFCGLGFGICRWEREQGFYLEWNGFFLGVVGRRALFDDILCYNTHGRSQKGGFQ